MSQESEWDPRRQRELDKKCDLPGSDLSGRGSAASTSRKRSKSLSVLHKFRALSPKKKENDGNVLSETKLPDPRLQQERSNQSHGSNHQAPHSSKDNNPEASAPQSVSPVMVSQNEMTRPPRLTRPHNNNSSMNNKVGVKMSIRGTMTLEGCKKKAIKYKMLLNELKHRRQELHDLATRPPSPETIILLKENRKQQMDVHEKLMAITSMVDMLMVKESAIQPNESPDREQDSGSPPSNKKFNYVYYDPEMHWCRVCDEFPPTAKDYLNHLHSSSHHKMAAQHAEAPWQYERGVNEGYPSFPTAPAKRTPIKGLQFFVPSTAWYCKLCSQFIGDWFCASAHLKSIKHSKNYNHFVEQNPSWETDWLSDRQKAFERARVRHPRPAENKTSCSVQYTAHTVTISKDLHMQSPSPQPEVKKKSHKKKKKRRNNSTDLSNHSDSSDSDSTKDTTSKRKKLKDREETEDLSLEDLVVMSNMQDTLSDSDRRLLETLRKRHEKDSDERPRSTSRDRERISEQLRKIRDSERRGFRSPEQRDGSPERAARGRDRRDRRARSRDRRDSGRDRREDGRNWRGHHRDRRDGSRDRRGDSRDRRGDSRERRDSSRDRRGDSSERRDSSRDRRAEHRDRRESRDRRGEHRERRYEERDLSEESLMAEFQAQLERQQQQLERQQLELELPPAALALPAPALPVPALPAPLPPPVVIPPPQPSLVAASRPTGLKDFQKALDVIFPTDPKKCSEMLEAMQQPGLLGPAPGMPFAPFLPPGMFGYDYSAGMFPAPLFDPNLPMMPPARPANPRQGGSNSNKRHRQADVTEHLDDLTMLGIDAGDVGANTNL